MKVNCDRNIENKRFSLGLMVKHYGQLKSCFKKGGLFFIFCMGLLSHGLCQNRFVRDRYNLDFENVKSDQEHAMWNVVGDRAVMEDCYFDKVRGKTSLSIEIGQYRIPIDFICRISQGIILPVNAEQKVTVSIFAKNECVDQAWMKIYCLDDKEDIVSCDSVKILSVDRWKKFSVSCSVQKARVMYIEIKAYTAYKNFPPQRNLFTFLLDGMDIKLGPKNIYQYPQPFVDNKNLVIKGEKEVVDLSLKNDSNLSKIEALKTHRIIGLGETVHGSLPINRSAFQFMKYLIKHENCKLVFLEINTDFGMLLNQYVKGAEVDIKNVFMSEILISPEEFWDFLDWLREYNRQFDDSHKVMLYGMETFSDGRYLKRYITSFDSKNKAMQELAEIAGGKKTMRAKGVLLEENDTIKSILGQRDYLMFSRFSKSISNVVSLILANKLSDFNMAELRRDSIMYESVVFGVDHFLHEGEKAVIYSHMIHLNKKHRSSFTPLDSSLGSFLSQKYKNDFYLIGFLTGEGTRSSYDRVFNPADSSYKEIFHAVNRLYSPPIGSLEKMCMRTQKSIFFSTLLPGDQDGVVLLRRVGRDVRDPQFEYANIPGRMDAYVFIRENTGFQIPPSWK